MYRVDGMNSVGPNSSTFRKIRKAEIFAEIPDGERSNGLPQGTLNFEEYYADRMRILKAIDRYGIDEVPHLSSPLKEHYLLFKKKLDFWWEIPIQKCLTREEIVSGCLSEGPNFAKWLSKARTYTYIASVAIGATNIPEEYILENYKGYDSIFRESDLLFWEEDVSDLEYSFIPIGEIKDEELFRKECSLFLNEVLPKCRFGKNQASLGWIKPSRCYYPGKEKTLPVRDGFRNLTQIREGFYGKRTKIFPFPAGARDTVMADPDTLAKLKIIKSFFAELSEHSENSGMSRKLNLNLERVLRKKLFHHLDFKKVGLTLPRRLLVVFGEEMNKKGIEIPFLRDISSIFVQDGEDCFETTRGYCLGWCNEAMNIIAIVLLRLWAKTYNLSVDFITFNDDVLIGDQDSDPETYCELIKLSLREFFSSYQILVSEKKIFSSRSAQFLEEYFFPERNNLEMDKRQIATALYAKAFCTHWTWEAKMFSEVAETYWESKTLFSKVSEGRYEKDPSESERPYLAGGWTTPLYNGLDDTLCGSHLNYVTELKKIRVKLLAERIVPFDEKKAWNRKTFQTTKSSKIYAKTDEIYEYLSEIDVSSWSWLVMARADTYSGRKKVFPNVIVSRVQALQTKFWDPPP